MKQGEIVHTEIATTDLARSREFLSAMFGWTFQEFGPTYHVWRGGENSGGGLMLVSQAPADGAVLPYVAVDSVEAALPRATALGGTVTMPREEIGAGMGFCAAIRIPGGARLGLWARQA